MKLGRFLPLLAVNAVLAVLTIVALLLSRESFELAFQGEKTTGQVIGLVQSTDSEGDTFYSPVVAFTVGDRTREVEGTTASHPPAYRVGQEVEVVYNPQDLSKAAINKFSELWLLPTIIGGTVAVLFVTLNLVMVGGIFVSNRSAE
ncbi:MAG: DUF3592 domain-containing protein [Anaerolineales bacterium]|nr:DUF3592 domain-containing protein [Anaerolineales bacterium]